VVRRRNCSRFYTLLRGSAGEVRSMLILCERLPYFADLKSEISDLKLKAESVSRQLRAWADSVQNSDIKGQRHLTAKSRAEYDGKKRADAFLEKLKQAQQKGSRSTQGSG